MENRESNDHHTPFIFAVTLVTRHAEWQNGGKYTSKFRSLIRNIEAAPRRYSRSEKSKIFCFFAHLIITLRLRLEGTNVRKFSNKFGISLT